LAHRQQLWLLLSLGLALVAGPAFTQFRRFAAFKYLWVVASLALFGLLILFGVEINGARLWIKVGPIQYEPIELIKLCIVLFLAAYLAEMADVIAAARAWSLRANLKYLGPLFIGWGASMAILVVQRDLGMATLLLATFATLLFVATRRIDIVVFGALLFAAGAFWSVHHYPYVQTRIAVWFHPFADPLGAGYQSSQAYYSLAAGGLAGTGYRLGHPQFIPDVPTDYVYAALAEEFGLIGAIVVLAIFLDLVRRILATGLEQPDLYTKLLAAGLGATLGFQVVIIVAGVIGLLPLTGITLPFISYGGSSLVANFLLVALVWAMSARPRRIAS
jgi:cell division protein FtsW